MYEAVFEEYQNLSMVVEEENRLANNRFIHSVLTHQATLLKTSNKYKHLSLNVVFHIYRSNTVTVDDNLGNIVHWIWKFECSYTSRIPLKATELVT